MCFLTFLKRYFEIDEISYYDQKKSCIKEINGIRLLESRGLISDPVSVDNVEEGAVSLTFHNIPFSNSNVVAPFMLYDEEETENLDKSVSQSYFKYR